jgi:mRNA interferase RelE/StbE
MTYYLEYMPKALKNWDKLDITIKKQFYKKLQERLKKSKSSKR